MDCDDCGSPCGSPITPNKPLLGALDTFGRQRLSKHYFMRDFLYSEVAAVHGIANVPDNPRLAIKSGSALCRNLLEPLRQVFGHVTIRSALRSVSVNGFCNCHGMNCSSNKASYANHIWDHLDGDGCMGATACIVIPGFADWVDERAGRDWRVLAWFIHEHLPYSEMVFFARNGTVNLTWRGDPNDPVPGRRCPPIRRKLREHRLAVQTQAQGSWLRFTEGTLDQERETKRGFRQEPALQGLPRLSPQHHPLPGHSGLSATASRGEDGISHPHRAIKEKTPIIGGLHEHGLTMPSINGIASIHQRSS